MTTVSEIPLRPLPQSLSATLSGKKYLLTVRWNWIAACWVLDIDDAAGVPKAHGIALVTGADLLEQYGYLGIGGQLFAASDNDADAVPTFSNLGSIGHLYYQTP